MKLMKCSCCGASKWKEDRDYLVCLYCGNKFQVIDDNPDRSYSNRFSVKGNSHNSSGKAKNSSITLDNDVERLLKKCRSEPQNAKKYANLVLDIDPTNREALNYL